MPRKTRKEETKSKIGSEPKFPYTTKPSSLRRLLQEIPKRPKPQKFDKDLLKSWGFGDTNDYTMLRVLKALGLLNSSNEPTELYSRYMQLGSGPAALADTIRRIYQPLFQASYTPYKESTEKLQNLFNIHSGGGRSALDQQIQTFKALCENTSFESAAPLQQQVTIDPSGPQTTAQGDLGPNAPVVHINLHIHLPENKTRRDYEAIIEDVGRYIFGRQPTERSNG
jgi:hypothetical protein